jgi:GAF domain-containing protein/signal transduction histidine kinase
MVPSITPDSKALLKAWTDINATLVAREVYQKACSAAVELLAVDHSTFVSFNEALEGGEVMAEYYRANLPENVRKVGAVGMMIPLAGIPEEQELITGGKPYLQYEDVTTLSDGVFKDNLLKLGVKSVVIFPVINRGGRMLGSFSLDSIEATRQFAEADHQLAAALATTIAQALENARLYEREQHRAHLLRELQDKRQHLNPASNEAEFHAALVDFAKDLSGWSVAILYRISQDFKTLNPVARSKECGGFSIPVSTRSWLGEQALNPKARSSLVCNMEDPELFASDPLLQGFRRATAIRLTPYRALEFVLVVLDVATDRPFADMDAEYLRMLAAQATIEIEKQVWWENVWEKLTLQFLHLIGPGPRDERELELMLYYFLTMVTAGFGLKFNRAVLFLRQETAEVLESRMGIGHLKRGDWEKSCEDDRKKQMDRFEAWFQSTQAGRAHTPTPLESWARERHVFRLDKVFADVMQNGDSPLILEASELARLPESLRQLLEPSGPVAVAPLRAGPNNIGVLVADREYSRQHLADGDQLLLRIFCRQAALPIGSYLRYRKLPAAMDLFDRISRIKVQDGFEKRSEQETIRVIVQTAAKAFDALGAGRLFINQHGKSGTIERSSDEVNLAWAEAMLEKAWIPEDVHERGIGTILEGSQIKSELASPEVKALIYLPIVRAGRTHGLIALYYFEQLGLGGPDTGTLQRYANEVSQVYEAWLSFHDRAEIQGTTAEILGDLPAGGTARRMVQAAHRTFDAKIVTFWPYDLRKNSFVVGKCVSYPLNEERPEPKRGGTTFRILETEYEDVGDVGQHGGKLREDTLRYLQDRGVKSLQGIALRAGDEVLGVLYVMYGEPRGFEADAKRRLREFGRMVSLVLKAALDVEHYRQAYQSAEEVSQVLAVGNIEDTLGQVAERCRKELRSDIVTMFECDERTHKPDFPPIAVNGAFNRERMEREDAEDALSLIPRLIARHDIIVARNPAQMQAEFETGFARAEGIESAVAIPLEFSKKYVGLMFASYRNSLPDNEVESIKPLAKMFANQAAVAIGNMKRFRALAKLAENIVAEDDRKSIFDITVKFVQEQFRTDCCAIVLKEGNQLFVAAEDGWDGRSPDVLEENSHAGFTIRTGRANWFSRLREVGKDKKFEGFQPPSRMIDMKIVSGLAVAVHGESDVLGGILVHTKAERNFTGEDAAFLSLVAAELMIAQRSVRRNQRTKAQYEAADALVNSSEKPLEWVLAQILMVGLKYLQDEVGRPKFSGARLEMTDEDLGDGEYSPVAEAGQPNLGLLKFREDLKDIDGPLGEIWFSGDGVRELDSEDKALIKDLANLGIIAARAWKERRRHLRNLGTMTHEMGRSYETAHMSAQRLLATKLDADQNDLINQIRADLGQMETLRQNAEYVIKVLNHQLKPSFSRFRAIDLQRMLQTIIREIESKATTRSIQMEVKSAPIPDRDNLYLHLDLELIKALYRNILDNAVKFNKSGGRVVCWSGVDDRYFKVEVQDSGPGISKSERESNIFRLWHQAAEHGDYSRDGLGAGLFICNKVLGMHPGSKLNLETNTIAPTGSTFTVLLPLGSPTLS